MARPYPALAKDMLPRVIHLYYEKRFSIQNIADHLGVGHATVQKFMKRHELKRRNPYEANQCVFHNKIPSFTVRSNLTLRQRELKTIGAMLYWAEGYDTPKAHHIDFANSDPFMIDIFVRFLRECYSIDEKRLRGAIYSYADQDIEEISDFWSTLTGIPREQFSKPFIRNDFKKDGRKTKFGTFHVRYHDKKLLIEIRNLIDSYVHLYKS